MLVFEERGKSEYLQKKKSQSREENQQTQPTYDAESGVELGLPFWEGSVLATTSSLHP